MTIAADFYDEQDSVFCSKRVCVMDAAGHLGSAIVHQLLLRGYTVHAAFQNHGLYPDPICEITLLCYYCWCMYDLNLISKD